MKAKYDFWVIFFMIIFLFEGCNYSQKKAKNENQKEEIKIGAILPMTGNLSFMGEYEKNGILLAADSLGIDVSIQDSKGSPKDALNTFFYLKSRTKLNALIISTTGASRAVIPAIKDTNLLIDAYCMDPTITMGKNNVYRLYYGMEDEAKEIAKFINTSHFKDVGILVVNHQGTIQQVYDYLLPELDPSIRVKIIEKYEFTQKNFRDFALKIKKSKIDILILSGYGFVYPEIFKSLYEYGLLNNLKIIGGWGFIARKILSVRYLKNVYVVVPNGVVRPNNLYKKFEKKYYEKFNKKGNFDAALAFLNVDLLNQLIHNRLKTGDTINSLLGKVSISKDRLLNLKLVIAKYDKRGNLQTLKYK